MSSEMVPSRKVEMFDAAPMVMFCGSDVDGEPPVPEDDVAVLTAPSTLKRALLKRVPFDGDIRADTNESLFATRELLKSITAVLDDPVEFMYRRALENEFSGLSSQNMFAPTVTEEIAPVPNNA